MKILNNFLLIIVLIALLSGCKTIEYPFFLSVENICKVRPGMTYSDVVAMLGNTPNDFYISQQGTNSIYIWKYKTLERIIRAKKTNRIGIENSGTKAYADKIKTVYAIFDKDLKLTTLVSDDGLSNGNSLVLFESIYYKAQISKDCKLCNDIEIKSEDTPIKKKKKIFGLF